MIGLVGFMMRFILIWALVGCAGALGCSDAGGTAAPTGEALYSERHSDGNTFACATCHALQEPASDGIRRPGHSIGDAANRPSFKNGQLDEILEAVNSCRVEWMAAPAFDSADSRWIALFEYLSAEAGDAEATALRYEIVQPPSELIGGDEMAGQELFNQSCVVCHGVDASGTVRAPELRGELLDAETIAVRARTSGATDSPVYDGLTGGRMPFWAADRLSDDELRDLIAFVLVNDGGGVGGSGGSGGTGGTGGLRPCEATHPSIGQVAQLQTFAHQVSGTAVIIDDCTIRVDDFVFDGAGIDVRFYGGVDGDYRSGFSMSEQDLRRPEGYDGETVFAQLPEGLTLSELNGISVWCAPVAASFGDGLFVEP